MQFIDFRDYAFLFSVQLYNAIFNEHLFVGLKYNGAHTLLFFLNIFVKFLHTALMKAHIVMSRDNEVIDVKALQLLG